MENRKTLSGNFAIQYGEKFFFISGDLKKVIREIDQEEFDYLCKVVAAPPEGNVLTIPADLVAKLDKECSFIEDASMLDFFKNEALAAVYTFASSVDGPITVHKLSENRSILLSNPESWSYDSCSGNSESTDTIKFFSIEKELLGTQHNAEKSEYANEHTPTTGHDGESMIESIARMGIAGSIGYIHHYHFDNGDFNNRIRTRWQKVYINDLSLDEILEEVRKAAEASVAAVVQ